EERSARRVDQADTAAHERERARIRVAAALRLVHVHYDAHAGGDQLLRRDAVQIAVVDDRNVVRREPAGQVLRAPVDASRPDELDETHRRTVERNSWPPSMRSISSCRSDS